MDERLAQIIKQSEELQGRAQEILTKLESAPADEVEGMKAQLNEISEQLEPLQKAREEAIRDAELEGLKGQVGTLNEALETLREPHAGFKLGAGDQKGDPAIYGEGSEHSFYEDVRLARAGDSKAFTRLEDSVGEDMKAMVEGTGSAGGFLVPPVVSSELLELRQASSVLRNRFSQVNVTATTLQIPSVTGGLTAGWVAELAEKPAADLTFAQIETSVYTAAGLAIVSNQLLADATHSVDSLVNSDLARRLAVVEEVAFIKGSGSGQPRGILNTSGVGTTTYTDGSPTVPELLDKIVDAIVAVNDQFFAPPDTILMRPSTWAAILKAREASAPSTYLVGVGSSAWGRRANDPLGYANNGVVGQLFGVDVVCSSNVPNNLGTGTNETAVIVGAFKEGLVLDRQGITTDRSEHVYFTSNQTVLRAEERVGFTAARYPKAFNVVGGTGLIGF